MAEDEVIDGAAAAAKILARMEPEQKKRIVRAITRREPELANKIEQKMFQTSAIKKLDAHATRALTQAVNHNDLAAALGEADQETREHVLSHMSEHRRELVAQALATRTMNESEDIRDARQRILDALDKVQSSGRKTSRSYTA